MYGEYKADGIVAVGATTLSLTFGPNARTRSWNVSQVTIQMDNAPLGSYAQLFKGSSLITPMLTTDVAGSGPSVLLNGTETMTVKWSAVTPGLQGRIFVVYDDGN